MEIFQAKEKETLLENAKQRKLKLSEIVAKEPVPSLFSVNIIVAGKPYVSIVVHFEKKSEIQNTPSERLFDAFLHGSDDFRKARFKLLPGIPHGPWVIRQSVGKRPLVVSHVLDVTYVGTPALLEAVIDTSSDAIANKVTTLCRSHIQKVSVGIGFLVEAQNENELPEALIGGVTYLNLDLAHATALN